MQTTMILLCADPTSEADTLQKMVMPGPVTQSHAAIEDNCKACHSLFHKEDQGILCMECHQEIKSDNQSGTGFHGLHETAKASKCKPCHTEHQGRDTAIAPLDITSFDHDLTDFPLTNKHAETTCDSCHAPGRKHREAESSCYACHYKKDIHQGGLGIECQTCHQTRGWDAVTYDHGQTGFKLEGAHTQKNCVQCHRNEDYKNQEPECASCHTTDDTHQGHLGTQCDKCHNSFSWQDVKFDHDLQTPFSLTGKHQVIDCLSCHTETLATQDLHQDCASCHNDKESHQGRFGPSCNRCHTTDSWTKSIFHHDTQTSFTLVGKHIPLKCHDCHADTTPLKTLPENCYGCHQEQDVHEKTLGDRCDRCHNAFDWKANIRFDHDFSNFPLIGKHMQVDCQSCHDSKRFSETSSSCLTCHQEEDIHNNTFGANCQDCHNPNGWDRWLFNHSTQTSFPLKGAHETLSCHQCHEPAAISSSLLSNNCISCHKRDDIHNGNFGLDCARCHNSVAFNIVEHDKL